MTSVEYRHEGSLRPVLLGALLAIYVARPLLVSESAATVAGDGLPFVMLTIVLATVWWLAAAARPHFSARFGLVEGAWLALIVWQAAGTLITLRTGAARAAINVGWEWAGLALAFVLLRQLIATDRETRAIVVVMIALAVVLSAYGLFQFSVSLPAMREEYRLHPEQVLRAAGVVAPPGSPARMLFEERLKSTEPMATFALANSLAGFLVPWLIMMVGIACLDTASDTSPRWRAHRWGLAALVATPIAVCLVLTKSRSAYGAGLLAVAGLMAARRIADRTSKRLPGLLFFISAMVVVALLSIAIGGGSLDRQIITEAIKSLSYRWHYWQAALRMIGDAPWFGCGLGNFQDVYTQYKLPEASEVVADPHNFLLEVWATSGTPALVAFVAVFVGVALCLRRASSSDGTTSEARARAVNRDQSNAGVYAVLGGAAAGFFLAFAVGLFAMVALPIELTLFGPIVVGVAAVIGWRWIEGGYLPRSLPLIAVAALLVNLLAAGGIGFAGVAGSLWLLVAISLCLGDAGRPAREFSRLVAVALLTASLALALACQWSAYLPVLRSRMLRAQAESDAALAEQNLRAAAQADPLSDEPWKDLAELGLARWNHKRDQRGIALWKQAQGEILRLRPQSSAAWHRAGDGYFLIYRQTGDQQALAETLKHYQRAVNLYPNQPLGRAHLAVALQAAGRRGDARHQAAEALRLHRLTPHADQRLPDDLAAELQQFVD